MKILLVIDLQKDFTDNDGNYERIKKYCEENRNNYDIILPTVFQNNLGENSNFIEKLNWEGCTNTCTKDAEIKPKNSKNPDNAFVEVKNTYSSLSVLDMFDKNDKIDIIGCDSDACVLATAFRLWDEGYNFRILTDYIYTTSETFANKDVIKIMKRNFGYCVV